MMNVIWEIINFIWENPPRAIFIALVLYFGYYTTYVADDDFWQNDDD